MRQADQRHLGRHHRVRRRRHLVERLQEHLPGARQHPDRQPRREVETARPLVRPHGRVVGRLGRELHHRHPVRHLGEVAQHRRRIGAGAVLRGELVERGRARRRPSPPRRGRAPGRGRRGRASPAPPPRSPRRCRARSPGRAATARRAPTPRRRARSAPARPAPPSPARARRSPARCASIASGSIRRRSKRWQRDEHRHRHLADLGGREDELHVRRRLLERLQQRVERRGAQHVHLVDDVDLEPRARPPGRRPSR